MDIEAFTEFKTGHLEPIETPLGQNWAFIPKPLSDGFKMSGSLWPLVAEARDAVGRLEQIKAILRDPFLLLGPMQRREALRSSSLEGTYTLPEELLLFDVEQEENEARRMPRSQKRNEQLEVSNHYEALRQGHDWVTEDKPLNQDLMLHLHKILMSGVRGKDKHPGEYRPGFVLVGRRPKRYIPPPAEFLDECLSDLVRFMDSTARIPDPLVKAFVVHYQFEAIHPFEDGNGRVGRTLLSLCVSKWLRASMPWLYMSEFFERTRREYVDRLFNVSANGEWDEWIAYCLNGTIEQAKASITRCELLRNLRDEYNERYGNTGPRMRQILDMLFRRPVIRIAQIAEKCGVSGESARNDIHKLVEAGVVREIPKTRPKAFVCYPILDAAYGDPLAIRAREGAGEPSEPPQ